MKSTKKQRHEIYKKAYKKLQSGDIDFICHFGHRIESLPEFLSITPEGWAVGSAFMLSYYHKDSYYLCRIPDLGRQFRLDLLTFCIEMTRP